MAKAKKTKTEALTVGIQDRADASVQIKRMGDLQREIERIQADHNDNVAELQKQADERVAPLMAEINAIHAGVQAWSEANRDALTDGG
ncbi:MAG: host-nuclease inhibitor Gam family protein, partial [Neisseria sicca]|nr:host-nuclease inhibitor Gam family protein [Neisseria sicca]